MFLIASSDPTLTIAAGAAMTGAITYLFKQLMDLSKSQTVQAKELGTVQGRQEGIQNLSAKVLETVHQAIEGKHTTEKKDPKQRPSTEDQGEDADDQTLRNT